MFGLGVRRTTKRTTKRTKKTTTKRRAPNLLRDSKGRFLPRKGAGYFNNLLQGVNQKLGLYQ